MDAVVAGVGTGFVPDILRVDLLDEEIGVERATAVERSRQLARCEGVLAGISAGAALEAGVQVATGHQDELDVAIVPDIGERYLSTDLYPAPERLHVGESGYDAVLETLGDRPPAAEADD